MSSSPVPIRIYRYEVRGLLGQSGSNEVFEAYDPILDRTVKIYRWTPSSDVFSVSLAGLDSCLSGLEGRDVEVFSEGAYICLVAANDGDGRAALDNLRTNGLFPGVWPAGAITTPARPPMPPPLPLPLPPPVEQQTGMASERGAFTAAFGRPIAPPMLPPEPGGFTHVFNPAGEGSLLPAMDAGGPDRGFLNAPPRRPAETGDFAAAFNAPADNPPRPMPGEPGAHTTVFRVGSTPPPLPAPRSEVWGGSSPQPMPSQAGDFTVSFNRPADNPIGPSIPPRAGSDHLGMPPPIPSQPGNFTEAFNLPADTSSGAQFPPRAEPANLGSPTLPAEPGSYTGAFHRPADNMLTTPPPMPSSTPFSTGQPPFQPVVGSSAHSLETEAVRPKAKSRLGRAPKKYGWVWMVSLGGAAILGMFVAIWLHDNPTLFASRSSGGGVETKSVKVATPAEPQSTAGQSAGQTTPTQTTPTQTTGETPPHATVTPTTPTVPTPTIQTPTVAAQPSFACSKAVTPDEVLICRDARLAQFDVEMVTTYRKAIESLHPSARRGLERAHSKWFTTYSDKCNASPDDAQRSKCIETFLVDHTRELKKRIRR